MTRNEHVYAIYCRMEVAGDVMSGENVKATDGYAVLNFEAHSISSLTVGPPEPDFRGQGAKMST